MWYQLTVVYSYKSFSNELTPVRSHGCAFQAEEKLMKCNMKTNQKKPAKETLQKLTKLTILTGKNFVFFNSVQQ